MKFYLSFLISLLFITCNNEFDPTGNFQEKYILTCILRSDTTYQTAYITKSYESTDNNFSSIENADVRVWYNDSVFVLTDTILSPGISSPAIYKSDKFKVSANKQIEIEVLLPNGKRLRSQSTTPGEINFAESEVLIPPVNKNIISITWDNLPIGTFYTYRLMFKYARNNNGIIEHMTKEIPLSYTNEGSELKPVFPTPTNNTTVIYQLSAITETLNNISLNDPVKSNYSVSEHLTFELFGYDENLSKYISSTSGLFDNLTIRLNELDFTNIEGGLGIFGSFNNQNYSRLRFQVNYIESFGYRFISD